MTFVKISWLKKTFALTDKRPKRRGQGSLCKISLLVWTGGQSLSLLSGLSVHILGSVCASVSLPAASFPFGLPACHLPTSKTWQPFKHFLSSQFQILSYLTTHLLPASWSVTSRHFTLSSVQRSLADYHSYLCDLLVPSPDSWEFPTLSPTLTHCRIVMCSPWTGWYGRKDKHFYRSWYQ